MYEARQRKEKVSRRVDGSGMTRQMMRKTNECQMSGKNSPIIQRRTIIGYIYVKKTGGFEHRGQTNPHGTNISNLIYGQHNQRIIGPSLFNRVNIRGHLVKALWDNGNEEYRITQWNEAHETMWTSFENIVEERANMHRGNSQTWEIKTITDDPNIGDRLLGDNWNKAKIRLKNITLPQYNQAKEVLNRQISHATMYLNGNQQIGEINCPDISYELRLNP